MCQVMMFFPLKGARDERKKKYKENLCMKSSSATTVRYEGNNKKK
jgi:hypothetical protein